MAMWYVVYFHKYLCRQLKGSGMEIKMKKQLAVDLEHKTKDLEEFIQCIEEYLTKNKYKYEFFTKDKPARVFFDNKEHKCDLMCMPHLMGESWFLTFTEV